MSHCIASRRTALLMSRGSLCVAIWDYVSRTCPNSSAVLDALLHSCGKSPTRARLLNRRGPPLGGAPFANHPADSTKYSNVRATASWALAILSSDDALVSATFLRELSDGSSLSRQSGLPVGYTSSRPTPALGY
ncbi:hypothetical protein QAD02_010500 [Eretmocerus hayati]|uniref:Uncharacterized protein n=1 Tax=Eretmocerus hayati TaxID=131215 RepID=A0ACC2NUE2_9HYME|nr:hypothetical protein QAD02_010500 [Eretmocerus hayati]